MPNNKHLRLLSEQQLEKVIPMKFKYGFAPDNEEEEEEPKNYYKIAQTLRIDRERFFANISMKNDRRSKTLNVPHYIDHILFTFQGQFVISDFFKIYYNNFGLEAVAFYDFGKKGLFSIIDHDKFRVFMNEVHKFIQKELEYKTELDYENYVLYIASFKLLQIREIVKFRLDQMQGLVYLSLMNLPLNDKLKTDILKRLFIYLKEKLIVFKFDESNNRLELNNPTTEILQEIIDNFDIIESATNSAFTAVRPGEFNTVTRAQDINIVNADEDLPIIGIIDTGISSTSAIAPLLINDNSFALNGDPFIDVANRNAHGHGTAVAGLAALGKLNHFNNFEQDVFADAKVLSIKTSDYGGGYISEIDLVKMLYDVKEKYPDIKIFTLTTCYNRYKATNEDFSDYTYTLDKFAFETNSLIFICTANNDDAIDDNSSYDLKYFYTEKTNICTPADSMNNFTVGAAADNITNSPFFGIASGREFPTLFSRKGHVDLSLIFSRNKINKNYFKPDVVESGGDFVDFDNSYLDWASEASLNVISARANIGLFEETGTSFSTPLVANLAAKIQKQYPKLNTQTIKALIINSASLNKIPFDNTVSKLRNRVAGHGYIDNFKSVFSNENSATLILEDRISDDDLKVYPINFPQYLTETDFGKQRGIVKITATLCFNFLPIKNNQLSYNPIHIAFSIFKNHEAEDIIRSNVEVNSKLKAGLTWSQNGRFKSKPIPYSNTQKIELNVNVSDLVNEENTFKLAVHCLVTDQIIGGLPARYPNEFPFSLVINIEETTKNQTGLLYDEIQLINSIEVINNINTDLEAEN
jgi:Subtilase family